MTLINHWKYKNLYHPSEYDLNSALAKKCKKIGSLEYLCETYTGIKNKDIISLLSEIHNANKIFRGNGIDLGGGPGVISGTLVNHFKNINSIILLEIVKDVIESCFPIIRNQYLTDQNKEKIIPTTGSFDEMQIDDNKLDFGIAWDAIHHSFNPVITLKEVNRALIKGGYLVIIDRAHNNNTSDKEINRMLNIEYSDQFILDNNLPLGTKLTRSQNGEHEYRFKEWEYFFKESNFEVVFKSLLLENHSRNKNYINDAYLKQINVPFIIGGFERRKVIYVLQKK